MQQREALSAYMDGHEVNGKFADTLCNSAELQEKWATYHTIRSVMRNERMILGADFSANMAALIEQETMDAPSVGESMKKGKSGLTLKRWAMPMMQTAIAASVCLVAVVGVNYFNAQQEVTQTAQPVLQTLPFSNSVQAVSYNSPAKDQPTEAQLERQQQRLNHLLQSHELQRRASAGQIGLSEAEKQKSQTSSTEQSAP